MNEEVKIFVTRLVDEFIKKFRLYQVERLKAFYQSPNFELKVVETMAQGNQGRKVSANSEEWDMGTLVSIFHQY